MIPPKANFYAMIIFLYIFFVTMIVQGKTIFILFKFFSKIVVYTYCLAKKHM